MKVARILWLLALLALPGFARPTHQVASAPPNRVPTKRLHEDLRTQLQNALHIADEEPLPMVWHNPRAGDPGVDVQNGVPEGLTLVDETGRPTDRIDPTKGVAIYIHGWTPSGDTPKFLYADLWRKHGFNTFIYRWHAHTQGQSIEDALRAEGQAATGPIAGKLVGQIQLLRKILDHGKVGSWPGEIRLIGYSMGAYVALRAAHESFYVEAPYANLDWRKKRLRRVDLLEPAFIDEFLRTDQVYVGGYQHTKILTSTEINKNMVGIPADLRSWGVPVLAFSSVVYRNIAPGLEKAMPTQELSPKWTPTANPPNIEDQHTRILAYYFRSIDGKPPRVQNTGKRAFSAATPTAQIRGLPLMKLVQVGGTKSLSASDDVYFEEKVPSTRGGALVDQEPLYPSVTNGSDSAITFPVGQWNY